MLSKKNKLIQHYLKFKHYYSQIKTDYTLTTFEKICFLPTFINFSIKMSYIAHAYMHYDVSHDLIELDKLSSFVPSPIFTVIIMFSISMGLFSVSYRNFKSIKESEKKLKFQLESSNFTLQEFNQQRRMMRTAVFVSKAAPVAKACVGCITAAISCDVALESYSGVSPIKESMNVVRGHQTASDMVRHINDRDLYREYKQINPDHASLDPRTIDKIVKKKGESLADIIKKSS